jgi:hypothetical protein
MGLFGGTPEEAARLLGGKDKTYGSYEDVDIHGSSRFFTEINVREAYFILNF